MTYLRYLALGGFKSFRDWSLLELSPAVNVVVGGNGTGKSTLVEALLWCLGEEDLAALRARGADDLLYRPPARPAQREQDIARQSLFTHEAEERRAAQEAAWAAEAAGVEEARVYLVLGDENGPGGDASEDEEADGCCCRDTSAPRTDLPPGVATVGRTIQRNGAGLRLLDGEPASEEAVAQALHPYGYDRSLVSVVRQGELERFLVAGPALRARILADSAGIDLWSGSRPRALVAPGNGPAGERERLVRAWLEEDGVDAAAVGGVDSLLRLLGIAPSDADDGMTAQVEPDAVREQLAEAQSRVEDRFRRFFRLLVPGSVAALPLELPEEPDQATLDVRVAFPSGDWEPLEGLSGGQRALAAFSLGLAFFLEAPSRLLILDEVEPALDESNLKRFNEVLHEVAQSRQVIVVSHQRRTKDVGDVVFGVDHGGFGASTLHFRFEPATKKLLVFGRVRGNWLERTAALSADLEGGLGADAASTDPSPKDGSCC